MKPRPDEVSESLIALFQTILMKITTYPADRFLQKNY